jgi:hypothetical protein
MREILDVQAPEAVTNIRAKAADDEGRKVEKPREIPLKWQYCDWVGQREWHGKKRRDVRSIAFRQHKRKHRKVIALKR